MAVGSSGGWRHVHRLTTTISRMRSRTAVHSCSRTGGSGFTVVGRGGGGGGRGGGGARNYAARSFLPNRPEIEGVKDIIAVASGKGGVGKSTTAVNLAVSLASECNLRVGLLDADVYGPSIPRLMDLRGRPRLDEGDAQISISQRVPLSGAVIVSTPQDISLIDARRGANMFRKVDVPILGLIENMSYYICPNCKSEAHIFGHGGAKETAKEMGMEFLGEVPLNITIRQTSDDGRPITITDAGSAEAQIYARIVRRIAAKLRASADESHAHRAPRIIEE
ncbi:hypothetical protein CBR_g8372 [Chara braunii]|uniref:CobQ/CobB/MinD/ParA nucleotide binding domain-containing protein n=1 Tax=Chara braunii TaxID=69332 RepID=A0A388KMA0_CHABU|nr:hypothetical protein CBR_g8372 [Chara braunii]|eukprot:GBG71073.1 hypothetical protein CBR_g8372 [Chara braunii]